MKGTETKEPTMTNHPITPMIDRSGLAPMICTVASMLGMLVLVAASAVHMMI